MACRTFAGASLQRPRAERGLPLGLRGWVRNRRDGTVEAVAAGDAAAVQALAGWARQGPPAAQVTRVEVGDAADDGELPPAFEQRPTA